MNEKRIKMKTRNVSVGHGCLPMTKSHNSCKTCSIEKPVGDAHIRFVVVHAYIRTDVQRSANLVGGITSTHIWLQTCNRNLPLVQNQTFHSLYLLPPLLHLSPPLLPLQPFSFLQSPKSTSSSLHQSLSSCRMQDKVSKFKHAFERVHDSERRPVIFQHCSKNSTTQREKISFFPKFHDSEKKDQFLSKIQRLREKISFSLKPKLNS